MKMGINQWMVACVVSRKSQQLLEDMLSDIIGLSFQQFQSLLQLDHKVGIPIDQFRFLILGCQYYFVCCL